MYNITREERSKNDFFCAKYRKPNDEKKGAILMKKLIALLTAVLMLLSVSGTIYAAPLTSQNDVRLCYNSEFDFTVAERDGENNTTVRTFERESNTSVAEMSVALESTGLSQAKKAETEAILSALGMEDEFIERLSDEALQQYSTSPQIISTVSYIKTDKNGNSVNVTKEEAEEATAGTRGLTLPPHIYDGPTGGGEVEGYSGYEQDTYMKLVFVVIYLGNAQYKFSVDATWLTAPFMRLADTLGACAQNFTVENVTRSGWYSYDVIIENLINVTRYSQTNDFQQSDFQNAITGNWYGSAVLFHLRADAYALDPSYPSVYYVNHRIHYEYVGTVLYPSQECYFNTTATYEHTEIDIIPSLSIGISTAGPEATIGLEGTWSKDSWTVDFDTSIHYVPD